MINTNIQFVCSPKDVEDVHKNLKLQQIAIDQTFYHDYNNLQ